MLVDAHCHLSELSPEDCAATLTRAWSAGVDRLVLINSRADATDIARTLAIAESDDRIVCGLAVHPHEAKALTDASFDALARVITASKKVRAVGEIGLDYHYMHSEREPQRAVLRRFTQLARQIRKPVIIHDRACADECVTILQDEGAREVGGMVHCFTGDTELARAYLDLGFYVSFTGIITFKKSEALRDVVRLVPLERMMIETDSPYLAPEPHRGRKNEPAFVRHVAECVASVKATSLETVLATTGHNAAAFFQLP